jgi:hypothetical protein
MKFTDWMAIKEGWFGGGPKIPQELQGVYDFVQKNPTLKQDLQDRLTARKQPMDQALQDISQYKQLQTYWNYVKQGQMGQQPTGAEPNVQYTGDLGKNSPPGGKDLTGKVWGGYDPSKGKRF